jgi:C1A family cysteine protease
VRGRRVLNVIPSPNRERDWMAETVGVEAGTIRAAAPVPNAKDLRETWWEVGDQRSTGSCVGWASADSLLRWHFVKAGKLKQADHLSVRFAWMASKEIDSNTERPTTFVELAGTSIKSSLDVARKYGAVQDHVLKFTVGAFYTLASELRIRSYLNLSLGFGGNTVKTWRRWIAEVGPILTRLNVDDSWMNAKKTAGKLEVYDSGSADGGHAVALVGYRAGVFVVRNSWGTGWGDKGFAYASDAYAKEAFTEAYGVVL